MRSASACCSLSLGPAACLSAASPSSSVQVLILLGTWV